MPLRFVGLMNLILILSCTINIQRGYPNLVIIFKSKENATRTANECLLTLACVWTYFGMMLYIAKLYSLMPV